MRSPGVGAHSQERQYWDTGGKAEFPGTGGGCMMTLRGTEGHTDRN